MVFYHNSIAQIMGSMGLVGIAAYGVLMPGSYRPAAGRKNALCPGRWL